MANRNGELNQNLVNQALIERGGDHRDMEETLDLNPITHGNLLHELGGRVTNATPLRLLCRKRLTKSDVDDHQSRFVISKEVVEKRFVRCLSLEQRILLDREQVIEVLGFNEAGHKWQLKLKKRVQRSNESISYVLQGKWAEMVHKNKWKKGTQIRIGGFPYGGVRDHWNFRPENGFNEIYFVFTANA